MIKSSFMVNEYSEQWFSLFLRPLQPDQTEREIDFIGRNLPQSEYHTIMDLGCGIGRHANSLAYRGYQVLGVDNHAGAFTLARKNSAANAAYLQKDIRHLSEVAGSFDAILSLWQSFGYFDENTNCAILSQIAKKLNSRGRFILDIYHREFFEQYQGERTLTRENVTITEIRSMQANRLNVSLVYNFLEKVDRFDWQLYSPAELVELLRDIGLRCVLACTNFNEAELPSKDNPRVQYVFEKMILK